MTKILHTPVCVGSYDDAGMITDANGNELFSVGQNEDTWTLTEQQVLLAMTVCHRLNNFTVLEQRLAIALKALAFISALPEDPKELVHEEYQDCRCTAYNALQDMNNAEESLT